MSTFSISAEAFAAAQEEMGEEVRLIRNAAYPLHVILTERHVQALGDDGQSLVDTTALYMDVSTVELGKWRLTTLEHGDKINRAGHDFVVVSVMDRMGYQRAQLHQHKPLARAW